MKISRSDAIKSLAPYVFKEIDDQVAALRKRGVTPLDFGVGDPAEPAPDFVREAACKATEKHACTGYPNYTGSKEYREAAAGYMRRRFGVGLNPETGICSTIGSKEAIFNFPNAFVNPGDITIIPSPGYPPMKTGTIFSGGEPYFVPLLEENDFLPDYDAIPDEVAKSAKIIWINYPNSPTGAVADRSYYEGLIGWAKKYDLIIAADEGCYIDIYFNEPPISILEVGREGIAAFYSLSKRNNMTGYRVGFVAGDPAIIDVFKKLKMNIDSGTPNIAQEAAIAALNDDRHAEEMRRLYAKKREILYGALSGLGLPVRKAEAAFYIWQKVPEGMSDIDFARKLLDPSTAIVVTPGSLISDVCDGGVNPGGGYVRFALTPTVAEVEKAVERLEKLKPTGLFQPRLRA